MSARRSTFRTLGLLCVLAGCLALGVSAASAAVTHEYLSQITDVPAVGPHGEAVPIPGPLTEVDSLTADSGDVWVAEHVSGSTSYRVDEFEASSGAFVSQFPQVPGVDELRHGVAVGHATGEAHTYVVGAEGSSQVVLVFGATGGLLGKWTGNDTPNKTFGCITCGGEVSHIAVDNATSLGDWAAGDVYVADTVNNVIDVFQPEAEGKEKLVAELSGVSPSEPFIGPSSVAVSASNGDVAVLDEGGVGIFKPAPLAGQYEFVRKLNGPPPSGSFGEIHNLAIDGSDGDIYVAERSAVDEFSSTGAYLGRLTGEGTPAGSFDDVFSVAADPVTHRVFVGDYREQEGGHIDVFGPNIVVPDATTEPPTNVQPASVTLNGIVNPTEIQVSDCHFDYGTTMSYGLSVPCAQTPAQIGSGNAPVAVSADVSGLTSGAVYHFRLSASNANGANTGSDRLFGPPRIAIGSASSENVTQMAATLQAQINPDALDTIYRFEYGASPSYGASVPVPDGDIGAGTSDQAVSADLSGLQSGITYHYRVVAVNAAGTVAGADHTFTTVPPAPIDSVTISDVTATSATVHARINPLGNGTTYHVEYGTSTSYGTSVPVPDSDVGSGMGDVAVTQQLTGLRPDTEYHVRIAAQNTLGVAHSGDHTFAYDTAGGGLPENRAYEMVTPPQKNAALIGVNFFSIWPDLSESGSRVINTATQCFADASSCSVNRGYPAVLYAFSRTAAGWVATSITPPATRFDANSAFAVSADAGTALFSVPTPPGGEDDWYAGGTDGSFVDIGPKFPPGGEASSGGSFAATADLSHIAWIKRGAEVGWPFDATSEGGGSLYEYVGTGNVAPLLVGVTGGVGSTDLISTCGTGLASVNSPIPGSLSADGRIVYFVVTGGAGCFGSGANAGVPVSSQALYARVDESRTVPISQHSPLDCTGECQSSAPSAASFSGASSDGSRAFFTDTQRLTNSASEDGQSGDSALNGCSQTTGPNGCNLYLYDFANPTGENLVDVSAGDASGGGPRVQGVVAIAADGSHVYFVAKGVLSGAANEQGQSAQDGANNLYAFERSADHPSGRVTFIATLSDADSQEWAEGGGEQANVTPNGRVLVFTSHGDLTPDDSSGARITQVFRYDAQSGQLVRISIGEKGFNDNGNRPNNEACATGQTPCENATIVPPFKFANREGAARSDPTMSHDGAHIFFQSPVGLTPQALDDVQIGTYGTEPFYAQNVYEWHDGHVFLISDGRDVSTSPSPCQMFSSVCLIGTDASGSNAFFSTADPLVPQDTDTQVDYYDARVCTTSDQCLASAPPPLPPCLGEVCHGTPAGTPLVPSAPTVTFNGQGNLTPPFSTRVVAKKTTRKTVRCAKGKKHARGKCVRAKSRKKAKSHKGGK